MPNAAKQQCPKARLLDKNSHDLVYSKENTLRSLLAQAKSKQEEQDCRPLPLSQHCENTAEEQRLASASRKHAVNTDGVISDSKVNCQARILPLPPGSHCMPGNRKKHPPALFPFKKPLPPPEVRHRTLICILIAAFV